MREVSRGLCAGVHNTVRAQRDFSEWREFPLALLMCTGLANRGYGPTARMALRGLDAATKRTGSRLKDDNFHRFFSNQPIYWRNDLSATFVRVGPYGIVGHSNARHDPHLSRNQEAVAYDAYLGNEQCEWGYLERLERFNPQGPPLAMAEEYLERAEGLEREQAGPRYIAIIQDAARGNRH
jgi:hypothetical protein